MSVLHVITGLSAGGAQTALYKLLSRLDPQLFQSEVLSFTGDQPIGERIRALGVTVSALNMRPGAPDPRLLARTRKHIQRSRPDIVQTWMYHADLMGGLAARLAGAPAVIWNIRHTLARTSDVKRS